MDDTVFDLKELAPAGCLHLPAPVSVPDSFAVAFYDLLSVRNWDNIV